jgi:adenosine deaminase
MVPPPARDWIVALPKAEVHLHLEGAVPPGVAAGPESAADPPVIGSLAELLAYLDRLCGQIERPEQLGEIARRLSRRGREAGARHLDVIVNPLHWPHWRRRLGAMVDVLDGALREAEHDGGPTVGVCVSVSRTATAQHAQELVELVLALAHPRVVGLSIDGNEAAGSHNERFAGAFATAARAGLRRCAHAGESSGPTGVREAVEMLGAERIDHGIRCVEEPGLVAELAERGVPLDICPTSNVVLGLVPDLGAHPIEPLRRAGVAVSVNTDDPLLYGIDLVGEYERCASSFGWGRAELGDVARTSIQSCFAAPERRAEMLDELERYLGS